MANAAKPDPVVGMDVTWIEPCDDPANSRFIQKSLIELIGRAGLKVYSVGSQNCVFLTKYGAIVPGLYGSDKPLECSWHYLKPLTEKEKLFANL